MHKSYVVEMSVCACVCVRAFTFICMSVVQNTIINMKASVPVSCPYSDA